MLGEDPDATPLCPSIRMRLGCGRCRALRPGELRHEFHTEPDKSTRDDRRTRDERNTHDYRYADERRL
jgi:hypothetical protein